MPELPEVETVTNSVKKHIINESFDSMTVIWPKTLHNISNADFEKKVQGKNRVFGYLYNSIPSLTERFRS